MKQKCIQAVSQALGRNLSPNEAAGIEADIRKWQRIEARKDPVRWRGLTPDQQLQEAAQKAAQDLVAEARKKKMRMGLTIQAHDRVENFVNDAKAGGLTGLDALRRMLVFVADGKSNTLSVESRANAIRANSIRQMIDTFEAVDPKFWGLLESPEGVAELTRAIFGEQTSDPRIDAGAKAWLDLAEQMKRQFNDAGGKVRDLDDWHIPQHHSQLRVSKVDADKWIEDTLPLLNRSKYYKEDGMGMTDAELRDFLRSAYMSIATGGINKMVPGQLTGSGPMSNRHSESRAIHFKDAASYLKYQSMYGEKTLWGVMTGHVDALSRELAMLQTFGPNPNHTFRLFIERELKAAAEANPRNSRKLQKEAERLQNLYDFATGNTAPVVNEAMAKGFDTLRNWLVASRLGSAVITALSDEATLHLVGQVNRLPEMQLIRNELAALNLANRTEENLAHRAGLALDTMLGHLNRWGQDSLGNTWSNKMAATTMRASGLEALDGARRRAFGVTMLSALGEMVGKYGTLRDIDADDYRILLSKGITETDWAVWQKAGLEQWGAGNGVLTPESIMRISDADLAPIIQSEMARLNAEMQTKTQNIQNNAALDPQQRAQSIADWTTIFSDRIAALPNRVRMDAVQRLLGVTLEETDMAVTRPGMQDRFRTGSGLERGTLKGELARSFFVFKAFPLAMISRHFMRGWNQTTVGGKAYYLGSLVVGTTVLGAIAQTINDLLSGKNPRQYFGEGEFVKRNWIGAMLKGGSLGLYGDFLFSGVTQTSRTGPIAALAGPVFGLAEEAINLTQGNVVQALQGKETDFGAEAVRFAKGNTPGASLWYAKAALDHIIFHQLQEYFSPGYLAKMERRARQEFGQEYWWQPGTGVEGMQQPDLGNIKGD